MGTRPIQLTSNQPNSKKCWRMLDFFWPWPTATHTLAKSSVRWALQRSTWCLHKFAKNVAKTSKKRHLGLLAQIQCEINAVCQRTQAKTVKISRKIAIVPSMWRLSLTQTLTTTKSCMSIFSHLSIWQRGNKADSILTALSFSSSD